MSNRKIIRRRKPKKEQLFPIKSCKRTIVRRGRSRPTGGASKIFVASKRKQFYAALRNRLPLLRCSEMAGISYATYRNWMKLGKEPDKNPLHARFRFRVKHIVATNEQEALDIIRTAAKGGHQVVESKVTTGFKGTETTRIVKTALPVWTAAAWYLERTNREEYGRDATPESQKKSAEEQAQEVRDAIRALSQTVPIEDLEEETLPEDMPE